MPASVECAANTAGGGGGGDGVQARTQIPAVCKFLHEVAPITSSSNKNLEKRKEEGRERKKTECDRTVRFRSWHCLAHSLT